MKKVVAYLTPILILSLASCGGKLATSSGNSGSSSSASSPAGSGETSNASKSVSSSSDNVSSSSSSSVFVPEKAAFLNAIHAQNTSLRHYALTQSSYDQAFDANMMPIEGKYTVSALLSEASLYEDGIYEMKASSIIYATPVALLAPVSGNFTTLSSHRYDLKNSQDSITFTDEVDEEAGKSINYAIYPHDIIHSFSALSNSFGAPTSEPLEALEGGKDYFDALVKADPENYIYDATDPFVANPTTKNDDGTYTYSFSVHFSTCHYGDIYLANRRFDYFINLKNDLSLKDYGYSIEVFDPLFDSSGAITSYAADAAITYDYSALSSAILESFAGTLPDIATASYNEEGDPLNAAGTKLMLLTGPVASYDMSTLSSDSLTDDTVIASLAKALPNYLSWCTKATMDAILTNGDTGAVYEEHCVKTLYKNNFVETAGTLKATPVTSTTDASTEVTTYTYGSEEDVTYSYSLQVNADTLITTHKESESTVYNFPDPLNGVSPLASFGYGGDFFIPEYLPFSAQNYLNPSMLVNTLSGLTLDKSACQISSEGVLTLKGTDYASNYVISISDNKITDVVETPSAENVICYGAKATLTKTYSLSDPALTDYQA
jgi:hypothetical protein